MHVGGWGTADVQVIPRALAPGGGEMEPLMAFPMLQPCDINVTYRTTAPTAQQGGTPTAQGSVTTTDLVLSLSPAVMQLIMRTSVQLQMTLGRSAPPTVRTQRYVLLHSGCKEYLKGNTAARETVDPLPSVSTAGLAFWRPAPMAGYCAVGDLVTCGGAFRPPPRPMRPALLLRDSVALVWPPVAYRRVWCDPAAGLGLWEPVAPEGFVALGCVAGAVDDPPPLNLVRCVRRKLLTPSVTFSFVPGDGVRLLQLGNCFHSFLVAPTAAATPTASKAMEVLTGTLPAGVPEAARMFDLRLPLGLQTEEASPTTASAATTASTSSDGYLPAPQTAAALRRQMLSPSHTMHRELTLIEMPPENSDKVWKDTDSAGWGPGRLVGGRPAAVWRPTDLPPDFSYLGDVIKPSHSEQPHSLYAVKDDPHLLELPTDYEVLWYDGGAPPPTPTPWATQIRSSGAVITYRLHMLRDACPIGSPQLRKTSLAPGKAVRGASTEGASRKASRSVGWVSGASRQRDGRAQDEPVEGGAPPGIRGAGRRAGAGPPQAGGGCHSLCARGPRRGAALADLRRRDVRVDLLLAVLLHQLAPD